MTLASADLVELVLTALAVLAIPGPSTLYVVARGVVGGRRAALAAVAGVDLGMALQTVAVAVGLGEVLSRSPTATLVVRAAGAVLLVLLGVRAFRDRAALAAQVRAGTPPAGARRTLRAGVLVGALNPKRLLLLVALVPQFARDGGAPRSVQLLALGAIVLTVALVTDLCWGLTVGGAHRWLARRPRVLRAFGAAAGGIMVALGVRVALGL